MTLPTGTVTLLFSDVEGSTRLWERFPEPMESVLARHDHLMRTAMEAEGGYVFKTVGDAFCVAFATSLDALRAALAAQRALSVEAWPAGMELKVRMALHTGACQERDGDYFGPAVNRVARLMAVASGGQVLTSGVTAELLHESRGEDVRLTDLGEHRLRDLGRPEHVFQVDAADLRSTFAPLRSLDNPELPNNLPGLLSSFVGRDEELDDVRQLVRDARLVTVTGAGGSGKTRLATQVAAEMLDGHGDGVWLVDLAPVADEEQVARTIAAVLGVKDVPDADPLESLVAALRAQSVLLVLDNCEHVVGACAKFADAVLRSCPGVHVLATSREPLGVGGERVYRVPSMSLPESDAETLEDVSHSDAVTLFLGRARDVDFVASDEDAALIASICHRLDGIPLALELAAARLSSMSLSQLHDRLDQRFRLLTGGSRNAMARQQTLQALVDWSYGLLTPAEQSVLRRLSAFVGGFTLEAAEAVCASALVDEFDVANVLHSLVAKSLVVADKGLGSVRFRLLETMRQYGAQKLLESDGDDVALLVRDRHADYYVALAVARGAESQGARFAESARTLDEESDNLRATFAHLCTTPSRSPDVFRAFEALRWYHWSRGRYELVPYLQSAIEVAEDEPSPALAGALVNAASQTMTYSWYETGAAEAAKAQAERALDMARSLAAPTEVSKALVSLSTYFFRVRDHERCDQLVVEAIAVARATGDDALVANVLWFGLTARTRSAAYTDAMADAEFEEIRTTWLARGYGYGEAAMEGYLASRAFLRGDVAEAEVRWRRALELFEANGARWWADPMRFNLCIVLAGSEKFEEAEPLLRRSLREARRSGLRSEFAPLLGLLGYQEAVRGDPRLGAQLFGAAKTQSVRGVDAGALAENTPWEDDLDRRIERLLREALGDEAYDREYALGARLSPSESIDLGLRGREREPAVDAAEQ